MAWWNDLGDAWDAVKDWGKRTRDYSNPLYWGRRAADGVTELTDAAGVTNVGGQEEAYDEAQETLQEQMASADATYGQMAGMIGQNRQAIADIIGPESVSAYKEMVANITPYNYTAPYDPIANYQFERDPSKYLDPNADYVIQQSVDAALQGMSGMGGLTGGAAARALQAEASAKAGELYGDAWDRMMDATSQEYGRMKDAVTAEQFNRSQMMEADKWKAGEMGDLFGSYVGNLQGGNEDLINLLNAQMQTNATLAQAMSQLGIDQANLPTGVQQLAGIFGDIAGGIGAISK